MPAMPLDELFGVGSGGRLLPFLLCGILVLILSHRGAAVAALSLNGRDQAICLPCSKRYVSNLPSDTHESHLSSSTSSCMGLAKKNALPTLEEFGRKLNGEGSHRILVSTLKLGSFVDSKMDLDDNHDEVVIVERLPNGVFADPYELQHLVERGVFLDAIVFGDTNLELPSALSNRSNVEIHISVTNFTLASSSVVVELPLHARYPPLDASGYASVQIGMPELHIRRMHKESNPDKCSWILSHLEPPSVEIIERNNWDIPCGNKEHADIVTSITFISAMACAFSIVLASFNFNPGAVHRS